MDRCVEAPGLTLDKYDYTLGKMKKLVPTLVVVGQRVQQILLTTPPAFV